MVENVHIPDIRVDYHNNILFHRYGCKYELAETIFS